ncbi:MAG TPA: hypothetical protein VHG08_02610 [Longimicrobium sp.]|nr:hypothetical protein [Longimicrobium sp.]
MDVSAFAQTLAYAALVLLAEAEDPAREIGRRPDGEVVAKVRSALVLLSHTDPADLRTLGTIANSLLAARDSFGSVAEVRHRKLGASYPVGGFRTLAREGAPRPFYVADAGDEKWNRLLDRHIDFVEISVLHAVIQTQLEHCGRLLGWEWDWQGDMQPFRSRALSRVGHPSRIGRFVAVAKLRDAVPRHIVEMPEKEFDMLFRDTHWGIPFSSFRTLESGEMWRDYFDVAQVFDPARLERATQLYLQYVMVTRAFHWPPDSFAVRMYYLTRLGQLARPAVAA